MSNRICTHTGLTPTGFADSADMADGQYPMAIQGATSTQLIYIKECVVSGQAIASAVNPMFLSFDSQVATGSLTKDANTSGANLTDSTAHGLASALSSPASVFNHAATLKPRRDTTRIGFDFSINSFGVKARLNWPLDECMVLFANVTPFGECSLSCRTGGTPGPVSAHIMYETL